MIKLDYLPYVPSPNKSSRDGGVKPTWIVLHAMQGTYLGSQSWFKNPKSQVSAHYLVSKKGEVVCMVKPEQKAWHTKNFNSVSLGIEMEDVPTVRGKADLKKNCLTDPNWCTDLELNAVAELVATLMVKYKISLAHVIGHNDPMLAKPPYNNDHKDVGPFFPWEKFRTLVKKHLEPPKEKKSE